MRARQVALEAALELGKRGLPVFPVRRDKAPATPRGFKDAVTDAESIRRLWIDHPAAGLAIATGAQAGLVVLDVDPDKGGDTSLSELERIHGPLPETMEVATGGGGRHLYFRHPGVEVKCSANQLGPGLDVRGDGGYVVAPPSQHPSGNTYRWVEGRGPDDLAPAALPAWIATTGNERQTNHNSTGNAEATEASEPVRRVLDRLEGVAETGNGWKALCPAHDDRNPSLSVSEGDDGRCLVNCFAGCGRDEVVGALGLEMSDLFVEHPKRKLASRLAADVERLGTSLFHDPDRNTYMTAPVRDHSETFRLGSEASKLWLRRLHYEQTGEALADDAMAELLSTLRAEALFDGPERSVHVRVAAHGDGIAIDTGNAAWEWIEVTAEGWSVRTEGGPVFVRDDSMHSLPAPSREGSIEELREFVNPASESNFILLVGATIAAFHPTGPYAIAYLTGEQGSAKSTTCRLIASLVDPRSAPLVMGKPTVRDLAAHANHVWLVGFDNLSTISVDFSNALCQLATGGGYRVRQLYTDNDPFVLDLKRPVVMNAIGQVAKRPDLLDRMLLVELAPIAPEDRRTETDLLASWETARPRVFGAILDGLSAALAHQDEVVLDGSPRMADVACWVEAAGQAFGWDPGAFTNALEAGQEDLLDSSLEANPEIAAIPVLMEGRDTWESSANKLLETLAAKVGDEMTSARSWPKRPDQLSQRLKEHSPNLRRLGFEITRRRKAGGNRDRLIRITRIDPDRDAGTGRDA